MYQCQGSNLLEPCYTVQTTKHPDFLMMWGSFSYYDAETLVFLPKNVKVICYNYLELLNDLLVQSMSK